VISVHLSPHQCAGVQSHLVPATEFQEH